MLDLSAKMRNTVDTHKIQDFMSKSAVTILVGFPSGKTHIGRNDGSSPAEEVSELAKKLHYGADKIPARPFLDEGMAEKKNELENELKKQIENLKQNGQANFNKVGTMAVGAVQEFVRSDHYKNNVPNAGSTIKKKGSDMPLLDTGEMLTSLTFLVEEKK